MYVVTLSCMPCDGAGWPQVRPSLVRRGDLTGAAAGDGGDVGPLILVRPS